MSYEKTNVGAKNFQFPMVGNLAEYLIGISILNEYPKNIGNKRIGLIALNRYKK